MAADGLGSQILGSITLSGLAMASAVALLIGVRGSDRIKLNTKERAGGFGILSGTLMVAAGGTWASVAHGLGSIPTSVLGNGSSLGDPGQGGIALVLTIATLAPRWRRMWIPAVLGISAAVVYGAAGGVWSIASTAVRMGIGHLTGSA
nr:hypothetical protein [Streptomyces sp. SID5468]